MEIYDISLAITPDMIVWPGDSKPSIELAMSIEKHGYNLSRLQMGAHNGTHIDAPSHFLKGAGGVDGVPLKNLIGEAQVLDFSDSERKKISRADLQTIKPESKILLMKTRNSGLYDKKVFTPDFVYLDESAAEWMVENGIVTIGVDYLSIGKFSAGATVHELLLKKSITVIEGLNLKAVKAGMYQLICLPLKIKDADGAPARAVLIKNIP